MSEKAVKQYLAKFAESESQTVDSLLEQQYQYCLIIPAYNETPEFLTAVISQCQQKSVLVILVINQPDTDTDTKSQLLLHQSALKKGILQAQRENLTLVSLSDNDSALLVIDRFSDGLTIPHKQGVGLARKIAMDVAVAAIYHGFVSSSAIYSTDADASLPEDYFSDSHLCKECSGGVFSFAHVAGENEAVNEATQIYQQRLQYYVDGLHFAGSSYAFHTIGSCLLVDMLAYCKVRGFPRRAGGEDFYLLNKLAKVGRIKALKPVIKIHSRLSQRVPFGTGPAVEQIIASNLSAQSYAIYDPQIFVRLKALLAELSLVSLAKREDIKDIQDIQEHVKVDTETREFLNIAGFFSACEKWQKQNYAPPQLHKAITEWFDGFRTLKYVHHMRQKLYPDIPLTIALETAPWY